MTVKKASSDDSICDRFKSDPYFRHIVLGTSQMCIDLCAALKLPVDVVAASLLYMQRFLDSFDIRELEIPLLCGSCVLLSWKYWEDFGSIRSLRKLNDICRALFKLLVLTDDSLANRRRSSCSETSATLSHSRSKSINARAVPSSSSSSNGSTAKGYEPPAKMLRPEVVVTGALDDSTLAVPRRGRPCSPTGFAREPCTLSAKTECTASSEKRFEAPRTRSIDKYSADHSLFADQWRGDELWESATWNWGPPGGRLSTTDWALRDGGREFCRMKEKIKVYEACLLRCLDFEVGPVELPFEVIDVAARYLWTEEVQFRRTSKARSPCCSALENSQDNTNNEDEHSERDQQEAVQLLQDLIELSSGFALDFYRAPYCVPYGGRQIGVAAVWKAAVALGFSCPFELSTLTLLEGRPSLPAEKLCQLQKEKELQRQLFSIDLSDLRMLLYQFRVLYEFVLEFEDLRFLPPPPTQRNVQTSPLFTQHSEEGTTVGESTAVTMASSNS